MMSEDVKEDNTENIDSEEEDYVNNSRDDPKHYLNRSFEDIYNMVIRNNQFFLDLFSSAELDLLKQFVENISITGRVLYLNIYGRKGNIIRPSSLKITGEEFDKSFTQLISHGLINDDLSVFSCKELLEVVNRLELSSIAKQFHVKTKDPMSTIKENLMNLTSNKRNFFTVTSDPSKRLHKAVSCALKGAFFCTDKISSFDKLFLCCSLTSEYMGRPSTTFRNNLKSELYHLHMVRQSQLSYPAYTINRQYKVFSSIDEIESYIGLSDFLNKMHIDFENKNYEHLNVILPPKLPKLLENVHDENMQKLDAPLYMRRFSKAYLSLNLLRLLVSVFEKLRLYEQASDLIEKILLKNKRPSNYVIESLGARKIGKLINRYVVDKASHVKQPLQAVEFLKVLNLDLRSGEKLTLSTKINQIVSQLDGSRNAKKGKLEIDFEDLVDDSCLFEPKLVHLKAPITINNNDIGHNRPMFLWQENEASNVLRVEEWVGRYYREKLGYSYAIHCESSLYLLFYTLLFYDVIYEFEKANVFYSLRQMAPLDLCYDEFYESRQFEIDNRLAMVLEESLRGECEIMMRTVYSEHIGERCLIINWELFEDIDQLIEAWLCISCEVMHAICEKLAKDYRNWRSGLPDLFVWCPSSKKYKIVEVKGPGDKLSNQQIAWLDVISRANGEAEVCHVEAVSKRKLK